MLQKRCIDFGRDELGLLIVPTFGGLSTGVRTGMKMKELGYEAGTWDLLVMEVCTHSTCMNAQNTSAVSARPDTHG